MSDHELILIGPFTFRVSPREVHTDLYVAQCTGAGGLDCWFQTSPGTVEAVTREHTAHAIKKNAKES